MKDDTLLIDAGIDGFWRQEELEQVSACPGCGMKIFAPRYEGLDDLLEQIPGSWSIVSCSGCGSLLLNPRPTRESVGKAYASTYCTHAPSVESHSHDNGASIWWRLANGYLNHRFGCVRSPASATGRWIVPLLWPLRQQLDYFYRDLPAKAGRLLDVGCGNGTFLLRARDAGWEIEGLEPDLMAAKSAQAAGLCVYNIFPKGFQPLEPYDRITLSHVFEHVHDPLELLEKCFEMTSPNGEIWLSMPNISGFGRRLYGQNWFALDPPRHLFLPTRKILEMMLKRVGFVDVRMHRRGRGAKTTLLPSDGYAKRRGARERWVFGWSVLIDLIASLLPGAAEEIVVSARRP